MLRALDYDVTVRRGFARKQQASTGPRKKPEPRHGLAVPRIRSAYLGPPTMTPRPSGLQRLLLGTSPIRRSPGRISVALPRFNRCFSGSRAAAARNQIYDP